MVDPGARVFELAFGGGRQDAQHAGGSVDLQSGKEMKPDQLGLRGRLGSKFIQHLVDLLQPVNRIAGARTRDRPPVDLTRSCQRAVKTSQGWANENQPL
jgi:hypothetical protein